MLRHRARLNRLVMPPSKRVSGKAKHTGSVLALGYRLEEATGLSVWALVWSLSTGEFLTSSSFPLTFIKAQQNRIEQSTEDKELYRLVLLPSPWFFRETRSYSLGNISLKSRVGMVYFPFTGKTFQNLQCWNSPGQSAASVEDALCAENRNRHGEGQGRAGGAKDIENVLSILLNLKKHKF